MATKPKPKGRGRGRARGDERRSASRPVRQRRQEDDQGRQESAVLSPWTSSNAVLPSEQVTSEQIEDTMSMLSDMGINVVEDDEALEDGEAAPAEGGESKELAEKAGTAVATATKKEPTDRTDVPPVRMYLREMGSVELLSREGEIAIAKRIEAGRETMIAGLCESPLTFQAIIIWREEAQRRAHPAARNHRSRDHLCRPGSQAAPRCPDTGRDRGGDEGKRAEKERAGGIRDAKKTSPKSAARTEARGRRRRGRRICQPVARRHGSRTQTAGDEHARHHRQHLQEAEQRLQDQQVENRLAASGTLSPSQQRRYKQLQVKS